MQIRLINSLEIHDRLKIKHCSLIYEDGSLIPYRLLLQKSHRRVAYEQQKFASHRCGGQEVLAQGAGTVWVPWGLLLAHRRLSSRCVLTWLGRAFWGLSCKEGH